MDAGTIAIEERIIKVTNKGLLIFKPLVDELRALETMPLPSKGVWSPQALAHANIYLKPHYIYQLCH